MLFIYRPPVSDLDRPVRPNGRGFDLAATHRFLISGLDIGALRNGASVRLASVVRLVAMRVLDLFLTRVGHSLHGERMTSVESHKGVALTSGLTVRLLVVAEK